MKLLSNLPIEELTQENDYLGVIEKGDMIVSLLKSGNIEFDQMKMFALYGNWGSGKSTLMKYMQKELDDTFQTFYFDAWQYENGKDLSFSLLEFMTEKGHDSIQKICTDLLSYGKKVLLGLIKASDPIVDRIVSEVQKPKEESFHFKIQQFKERFRDFEEAIFQQENGKKKTNIVFIDDLDRCEPEKVLDLLSEIKLFFTYGERTIFFFGIDEKAVQAAIKTKYDTVVKSNEYLEKIFDLDFKLSKSKISKSLIDNFFKTKLSIDSTMVDQFITPLFGQLKFNNPRKIKKVLNKYLLTMEYKKLFPNDRIIPSFKKGKDGSLMQTILGIYFIILKDFYDDKLIDMMDFKTKKVNYMSAHKKYAENFNQSNNNHYYFDQLITKNKIVDGVFRTFNSCKTNSDFSDFLIIFTPNQIRTIDTISLESHRNFENFIPEKSDITFKMVYYLIAIFLPNYKPSKEDEDEYKFIDFKDYVEKYV